MIECDVMPDFYHADEKVSRKTHRCCECGAPIDKGERYLSCVGKWEGEVVTNKQHLLCAEACMYIRDTWNEGCIGFGELFEWYCEFRRDIDDEKAKPFRDMMAQIIRRQRAAKA